MSKKHPYLLLTLLFSIGFLQLLAQNSLKIEARITNSEPTALVLMQHFGGHLMPVDTAFLGVDGMVVWEKKEKIPAGMCRIVGLGHGLDIFVSDSQVFSFEANLKDIVRTIEFKNSDDNTLFFNYQREIRRRYQPLLTYRQQEGIKDNNDPRWQSRFQELNENIKKYVDSLYKKQPQSLATHFLKSYQEPKLPILPLQQLTAKDSTYLQKYAWEHYFDHTFLSDERMLYTPTFPARFERFLKIIPQIPTEDITNLIDNVIQQTKGTVEMRKYVVGQLVQKFELTPSATFDRLYQHIVDNYVDNEPNLWDASTLQKVKEVQQIKEKIAIGRTFPSLPLTDFNGKEILHSSLQSQYTVLFFYDPNCSHCREATPKLSALVKQNSNQLKVYAVSLEPDKTTWVKFIEEFQTQHFINVQDSSRKIEFYKWGVFNYPTIYLLDHEKKLLARWLSVEQLAAYFDNR